MKCLRGLTLGLICICLVCCKAKKIPAAETGREGTDSQLENISGMLPGNQVDRTSEGIRVVFNSAILFNVNSSILTDEAKIAISKLAKAVENSSGDGSILINGYTDSSGTAEYNVWLSERRANSVKAQLESVGVPPSAIRVKGYGAADPVATNATPEGREKNRRVEVIIAGR